MKGWELDALESGDRVAAFLDDPALQWWEVIHTQEDMEQDEKADRTRDSNDNRMDSVSPRYLL